MTRGDTHDYLGMVLNFRSDKKVEVDMIKEIKKLIDNFSKDVKSTVTSPVRKDLFKIKEGKGWELSQERKEEFHSTVAKSIYIEKRARPDIETAVSFLSTRVTKSNKSDWFKLKRVLRWLWTTLKEKQILGIDENGKLWTYVDSSYAVYNNIRSQTGGVVTMVFGGLINKSSKQKINTKGTTESEILAVSDFLPYSIWLREFLLHQGYIVEEHNLMQDNQSAMRIKKNGWKSCTGNSRHISIRYFFVKDRIDKKEVTLHYCPSEKMLADYYTKPLQGKVFRMFWKVIMGHESI